VDEPVASCHSRMTGTGHAAEPLTVRRSPAAAAADQGLTLVPVSAQLELFCQPCNPA
jgi:hypothetical protein